jgi:hypothetical protein
LKFVAVSYRISGSSEATGIFVDSSGKSGDFNVFGARYVSSVQSDETDSSRRKFEANAGGQLFFPATQ